MHDACTDISEIVVFSRSLSVPLLQAPSGTSLPAVPEGERTSPLLVDLAREDSAQQALPSPSVMLQRGDPLGSSSDLSSPLLSICHSWKSPLLRSAAGREQGRAGQSPAARSGDTGTHFHLLAPFPPLTSGPGRY